MSSENNTSESRVKIPKELVQEYKDNKPLFDNALHKIKEIISKKLVEIKDTTLVRAKLRDSRVKELISLWIKGQRNDWDTKDIINLANDILGIRIVCNNLEDVYRARDLILSSSELTLIKDSIEDYFQRPKDSYRALHFIVNYCYSKDGQDVHVKCEIQIRTYLSDAWARLSHYDFYKETGNIPLYLNKSLQRLGSLLSLADGIAQDIREQISQPRITTERPDTEEITLESLAFIYHRAFGSHPPEYILRIVSNKCKELNINRSDAIDRKLTDGRFKEKLKRAYSSGYGLELYDEGIFEFIPIAVALGDQTALNKAQKRAEEEWKDIDRIYKSEVISSLPGTYEKFREMIEDDTDSMYTIYEIARAYDSLHKCIICGTGIVEDDLLAENIAEHYEIEDESGDIQSLIANSGVEIGSWEDSSICNHCDYMLSKDD